MIQLGGPCGGCGEKGVAGDCWDSLAEGACRPQWDPGNLDKSSKTRENRHSRAKRENRDKPTSILYS